MRDYKEAISAKNENWKSEARGLMERGIEFVIVHLKPEDYRDCMALAKEFGYSECLEDDTPAPQALNANRSGRLPGLDSSSVACQSRSQDHRLKPD